MATANTTKKAGTVDINLHTHEWEDASVLLDTNFDTSWNPTISITVTPHGEGMNMPEQFTLFMSGMSIERVTQMVDNFEDEVSEIREWNNGRMADENEELGA